MRLFIALTPVSIALVLVVAAAPADRLYTVEEMSPLYDQPIGLDCQMLEVQAEDKMLNDFVLGHTNGLLKIEVRPQGDRGLLGSPGDLVHDGTTNITITYLRNETEASVFEGVVPYRNVLGDIVMERPDDDIVRVSLYQHNTTLVNIWISGMPVSTIRSEWMVFDQG